MVPDGGFLVYSGADVGATFAVKAVTAGGDPYRFPDLALPEAPDACASSPGDGLVLLRGEIQHKNLWLIDLETGAERPLTNLTADFNITDFDVSPDGRELTSSAGRNTRISC